jgi:hypothetical protein
MNAMKFRIPGNTAPLLPRDYRCHHFPVDEKEAADVADTTVPSPLGKELVGSPVYAKGDDE